MRNKLFVAAIMAALAALVISVALYWYPPFGQTLVAVSADTPFLHTERGATVTDKVNINRATVAELTVLPGIGEKRAQAIVEYREENGLFESIDDLINVRGIGPKILADIADNITV